MSYTLGQAAAATGKAKSTISKAIKTGKISASKDESGSFQIDPSELHRVFPIEQETPKNGYLETPRENNALQREVNLLREMLDETRADRDEWKAQAKRITLLIEDQTAKKGFWARLMGN